MTTTTSFSQTQSFTQTAAAVALSANTNYSNLSGAIELIGQESFDEDTVWTAAELWATNTANTATTCTDEETCKWYFDGYVMNVIWTDSAAD